MSKCPSRLLQDEPITYATDSADQLAFELNEFDITDLVSEVVEQKRFELLRDAGVELKIGIKTSAKVRANRIVMRGVISNILNNAVEAVHPKGSALEINIEIVSGKAEIQVNDNRVGMSDETLMRLEHESFSTKGGIGREIGVAHGTSALFR